MESVIVSVNEFCGSLKLESLPDTLTEFHAFNNKFSGSVDLSQLPAALEFLTLSGNLLSGPVVLTHLPGRLEKLYLQDNKFTADPMDGHLYVVGRISTPSWGKPGAARYYGDPPWGQRAETRVSTILHCHGFLDSVANKNEAVNNDIKNQKTKNQTTRNQKTKNKM